VRVPQTRQRVVRAIRAGVCGEGHTKKRSARLRGSSAPERATLFSISAPRSLRTTRTLIAIIATIAATLALAGAARAEMPQNRGGPEVTGRAAIGWGVVGHNGTWLYDDGTACGPECEYTFAWERCDARGCNAIVGATSRVYKVRAVDVGYRFRVIVTTTKYDCGNWNYAEGTQECHWVRRAAASPQTSVVPKPNVKTKPKKKKRPRG
jgi:hypothetical protein